MSLLDRLTKKKKTFSNNIAIDGPAGSGKGTIAKLVSRRLNLKYLDTGSMYRALALYFFQEGISLNAFQVEYLDNIKIDFNSENEIMLNGMVVENEIRGPIISKLASDFSTILEIRKFLVKQQQEIVKQGNFVAEGRDIGTIVIPDARVKIYLTAEIEERTRRRMGDYVQKNIDITFEELKQQTIDRDEADLRKEFGALKLADDAIVIDNTSMEIGSQVDKIIELWKTRNL